MGHVDEWFRWQQKCSTFLFSPPSLCSCRRINLLNIQPLLLIITFKIGLSKKKIIKYCNLIEFSSKAISLINVHTDLLVGYVLIKTTDMSAKINFFLIFFFNSLNKIKKKKSEIFIQHYKNEKKKKYYTCLGCTLSTSHINRYNWLDVNLPNIFWCFLYCNVKLKCFWYTHQ